MKIGRLLILFAAVLLSGCDDTKINVEEGSGSITYEGTVYELNLMTMSTYPLENDGYKHDVIITSKRNGNTVFGFAIKDGVPENLITAGEYSVSFQGDYTANFSLGEDIGDVLSGVLTVTRNDEEYTFHFEGTTVDSNAETKAVLFSYKGKVK